MYNKVPPAVDSVGVNSKEKIEFSLIGILLSHNICTLQHFQGLYDHESELCY